MALDSSDVAGDKANYRLLDISAAAFMYMYIFLQMKSGMQNPNTITERSLHGQKMAINDR